MPMDREWGRARAVELLKRAASWFEGELPRQRWHTMLATKVGGLAVLACDARSREVAERILRDAPDAAFWAGAITNVPVAELRRRIRRELPSATELDQRFPFYGAAVLDHLKRFSGAHVLLVLEGRSQEAWESATTDLAKEEHLETCALVGDNKRVLELHEVLPPIRQDGPLMVACIESFRRDDEVTSRKMLDRLLDRRPNDCWMWIHLASGFLGRVPWAGYPFPDY